MSPMTTQQKSAGGQIIAFSTMFLLIMLLPARAQVILDMSLITCQQYLGYDPERQEMVASWMSGYFNASINQPVVSFERFDNNKRTVADYCRTHGYETLMSAIRQTVF